MNIFKQTGTLEQFINTIVDFQQRYWDCASALEAENMTALEVEFLYRKQNSIAIDLANFIFNKNINVEIFNNYQLNKK